MNISEELIRTRLQERYIIDHSDLEGERERRQFAAQNEDIKCAAVLIPLVYHQDEWSLVFTRRTDQVDSHKGQVAFPGGACDKEEHQPEQTALRETWEEIGVKAEDISILGKMNDIITITNFNVTPVVAVIPWLEHYSISTDEVSRVFKIPLNWLIQPSNWQEQDFFLDGDENAHKVLTYQPYDGEILWGASARITHNFLKILDLMK